MLRSLDGRKNSRDLSIDGMKYVSIKSKAFLDYLSNSHLLCSVELVGILWIKNYPRTFKNESISQRS
jgi:hypothetical protein